MYPRVLRHAWLPSAALACALGVAAHGAGAQTSAASAGVVRPSAEVASAEVTARLAAPFAGRWELNLDESALGGAVVPPSAMAMGVSERRGAIRVDVSQEVPGYRTARAAHRYAFDGTSRRAARRTGEERRASFAGDTLVLTRAVGRGGQRVVVTDRWFVAGGGTRLGMNRHIASGGDDATQFFVFDRRE
jgi:hypothetical protein